MQYYFIQEILVSAWLDNWRSACPERLFLMPKSRYFIKAEVVNIQTFLTKLSARVFTTVPV